MLKSAGIKREDAAANKDAVMDVLNFQMQYQQKQRGAAAAAAAAAVPNEPSSETSIERTEIPAGLPAHKNITLEELVNTSVDPNTLYVQSRKLGEGYVQTFTKL